MVQERQSAHSAHSAHSARSAGAAASKTDLSMSTAHRRRTIVELFWLQKAHMYVLAVYLPLCIAVVCISCFYANIAGQKERYSDPATQWQNCMTTADNMYIPLNATLGPVFNTIIATVANTRAALTTCITDQVTNVTSPCSIFSNDTMGFSCVGSLQHYCFSQSSVTVSVPQIPNVALPVGKLLGSLSYMGIQAIIFSFIAHAAVSRALRHPSWLPSTIALLIWFLYAILTYYTVNPVLPVPQQTNATLFLYMLYAGTYTKYDEYNGGDNECRVAFDYMWVYLTFLLLIAATVLADIVLAVYAEHVRYKKIKKYYEPLRNTHVPIVLAVIALLFYLVVALSKLYSSANTLNAIADYNQTLQQAGLARTKIWFSPIWFPFQQPTLDVSTLLYICSFMSVIRGYTIQSISAFRLSFASAAIFAIAFYPGIVGGLQFYYYNNFNNFSDCYNYFLNPDQSAFFGYPDLQQAKAYCYAFRLGIAGNLGLFVVMHAMAVACFMTFFENQHRTSQEFEPLDFTHAPYLSSLRAVVGQPREIPDAEGDAEGDATGAIEDLGFKPEDVDAQVNAPIHHQS